MENKIQEHLKELKLSWIKNNFIQISQQAAQEGHAPMAFLGELLEGEIHQRRERATARRLRAAHFPVEKGLENFHWEHPTNINRPLVESLFDLDFINHKENIVFLGPVGVGKTHLATALGLKACKQGHRVLFCNTIEAINDLYQAGRQGQHKEQIRKYIRADLLILDEIGYLPIDKKGCDLFFQIISQRYERGSIILTTNKAYKDWSQIFNDDSTVTSAILDRLLHHCQTIIIEGSSFRAKEK